MENVQFKFLSFQENLLATVLKDEPLDKTLFVFPTESSKQQAIRIFQKQWCFQDTLFLSMEELKEQLFVAGQPLLKEEKRTLAFYRALDAQDKQFFHIYNYFQSIELAHNFFTLWEEFNEEEIDDSIAFDAFVEYDAAMLAWQQKTWQQLLKIKQQYKKLLQQLGFDDVIFNYSVNNISLLVFQDVQRVVFVNQFYYTSLEKSIIRYFHNNGTQPIVYYQLEPDLLDTHDLSIKPFHVQDLGSFRNEHLQIVECSGEFSMFVNLISQIHDPGLRHIVDTSFFRNGYSQFLSPEKFNIRGSRSFSGSSIVRLFEALYQLSSDLVYEPNRKKILLPIEALLNVFADDVFCRFIIPEQTEQSREQTLHFLYDCLNDDFKFIDLDGDFFLTVARNEAAVHVQQAVKMLLQLKSINTITAFVERIDAENGFSIERIILPQENEHGNIRESFYRALADFAAIENIGLIEKWKEVFSPGKDETGFGMINGILRLFLEYLKPRTFQLDKRRTELPRIEITSLQDSRNLAYKSIAVMDVIEGKLPHPRTPLFLFTEKQRKIMGLKSYEDIKLREKYYFMRLVLSTPQVTLYTRKNVNDNIDISSFVEELRLFLKSQVHYTRVSQEYLQGVYPFILNNEKDYHAPDELPAGLPFYQIPYNKQQDFPQGDVRLSYYRYKNLLDNRFFFFLQNMCNVDEYAFQINYDFSARLIGQITHEYLNALWKALLEEHFIPPYNIDFAAIDDSLFDKVAEQVLKKHSFYYRFPHNHTDIYFHHILLPRLKDGVRAFFQYLHQQRLSGLDLNIYPEKEEDDLRPDYQPLIAAHENDAGLSVSITGRTDLRIEAADESAFWIVDYKSGSFEKEQLLIYELYYYLLQKPFLGEKVQSFFYNVLEQKTQHLSDYKINRKLAKDKDEYILPFKEKLVSVLNDLSYNAYGLAEQKSKMKYMQDVMRADLYHTRLGK